MPMTHDPHALRQAAIALVMAASNTPAGVAVIRRMLTAAVTPANDDVRIETARAELNRAALAAQQSVRHIERAEWLIEGGD